MQYVHYVHTDEGTECKISSFQLSEIPFQNLEWKQVLWHIMADCDNTYILLTTFP